MNKLVAPSGMGAWATKRAPVVVLACRKYGRKNLEAAESRAAGIWLSAKGWLVSGSVISAAPKFPALREGLMAKELKSVSVRMRVSSKLPKKKVLSFWIGPPALPPN